MFLVFFHEIIEANYKLMRNFGEKKLNQSFIEQFSEKYTSISIEKNIINSEYERLSNSS